MIDMHSKHENMHKNKIFYALICINNNIITYIDYMLSHIRSSVTPINANIVTCKWVFTIKKNPYDIVACHKTWLMAHEIDHIETLSLVVHLYFILVLFSFEVNYNWSLHRQDIGNTFLYEHLDEKVYMEQPLR